MVAAKEQKFYDKKGWPRPLRCKECRKNKNIAPRNPNKAPRQGGPGGAKNSGEGGDEITVVSPRDKWYDWNWD